MIFYRLTIRKAAVQTAAFFIFLLPLEGYSKTKIISSELQDVEKKAINLLIQKQKKQALAILTDYISNENNKSLITGAREFRINLAKKFPTKEAQEFYETSLNLTIDNPKDAKKNNEDCLLMDPDNLECLIQRVRLIYRENRKKLIDAIELEKTANYFEDNEINWIKTSTEQYLPTQSPIDSKIFNLSKGELVFTADEKFVLTVFDLNHALALNNISKGKEILDGIEKKFSDWPDVIYFKNRISVESAELKPTTATDLLNQYFNKCKNLNKSTVRKYRYDFDLCLRGVL